MNQSRGFTLIELMLVIAVIGILAAIAYPAYQHYIHAAKSADLLSRIELLREKTAVEYSEGRWPKNSGPISSGEWPKGVQLSPELLAVKHFSSQVFIINSGAAVAFMATDAQGRAIVNELRHLLPEKIVYAYYNRTMLAVHLIDWADTRSAAGGVTSSPVSSSVGPDPLVPAPGSATASSATGLTGSASVAAGGATSGPAQATLPPQSATAAPNVAATASPRPTIQSNTIPQVNIPAECLKPNGGYYHRNAHRPNCPI
ncbi:prepilin-type N-terminal cleavage/methylation domain-containing protein [Neptuniibacter sp. CAU 1671]|uniref:prepilin-type N-terminal cleavage/methylation domain-containing protein n=1 Tax=Neptuniibacter sp. CAU 1671 TaxID=3032593 RepID=UPI0023DAB766|nr:prepilin-type N-terminal cleavage/methylation domain-containing protein [Neptuniibacter sp. CAU 1671]MDF2182025.1 prepilin-type N-terminal cleavage/methylation domain-containing protein [Neptuniibacter sp. CAU 1671]